MKTFSYSIVTFIAIVLAISANASPPSEINPGSTKSLDTQKHTSTINDATTLANRAAQEYALHNYIASARDAAAAAKLGDCYSEYTSGLNYFTGLGVSVDYHKAAHWFTEALTCKGHNRNLYADNEVDIEFHLGWIYGIEKPPDYKMSRQWFMKCAESDNHKCEYYLGRLYQAGLGGSTDYKAAAHWFMRSATQGDSEAELYLGLLYYDGNGVPKNYETAYKWTILAKANSEPKDSDYNTIQKLIGEYESILTPEQIASAQQQASEWKPRVPEHNLSPAPSKPALTINKTPAHVSALSSTSSGGASSALSPDEIQILRQVLAANGKLTKAMHDKFWEAHKAKLRSQDYHVLTAVIGSLQMFQEYQVEIWTCVQTSYETGHVYKSKRLLTLQYDIPKHLSEAVAQNSNSQGYKDFMEGFQSSYKRSLNDTDRLLNAAANHQPITRPDGSTMQINEAVIQEVLGGIKGSIMRLKKLLDPNWNVN